MGKELTQSKEEEKYDEGAFDDDDDEVVPVKPTVQIKKDTVQVKKETSKPLVIQGKVQEIEDVY